MLQRYVENYLPWGDIHLPSRVLKFSFSFSQSGIGADMPATLYKPLISKFEGSGTHCITRWELGQGEPMQDATLGALLAVSNKWSVL